MSNLKRTLATYLSLAMVAQLSAPASANSTPQSATEDNFSINQTSIQEQEVRVLSSTIENSSVGIASGVTIDTSNFPSDDAAPVFTDVTWTAVSTRTGFDSLSGTQYLYLGEDITLSDTLTLESGVTLHLCLNGNTLTGAETGSVIRVNEGGTLYLYDSEEGMEKESYWSWVTADDGTQTYQESPDGTGDNLIGGIITGGTGRVGSESNTNGGGISSSGSVYMYGGNIAGNTATKDGGGITATNPAEDGSRVFEMYGGTITGNKAGASGGGVNTSTHVELVGGTISNNISTTQGGGLNLSLGTDKVACEVTISEDFIISDNKTEGNGGGVYIAGGMTDDNSPKFDSKLTLEGGTISDNTADGNGGGIYNLGELIVEDVIISENNAVNGGGIYNISEEKLTMTGGVISDNTATQNGGGVNNEGTFDFSGGKITDNSATQNGGGIRNADTLTITGGEISENTSVNGGGMFITEDGTFGMDGGKITANNATAHGGGICNNGTVTLSGGSISNNTATKVSDGIYQGGTFTLNGTVNIFGNDVYLLTAKVLTIGSDFDVETPPISLRVEDPATMSAPTQVAFTSGASEGDETKFTYSDFRNYEVVAADNSNELTLKEVGTWIDLNKENSNNPEAIITSGNYYLSGDLELSNGLTIGDENNADITVTLDLEGHQLSTSASGSVIIISSGCTLNLRDSYTADSTNYGYWEDNFDGTYTYKIEKDTPYNVNQYDTLIGGIITGGTGKAGNGVEANTNGGGISCSGILNMYGGNIAGNTATRDGGGITATQGDGDGAFTMIGGTIIGNKAGNNGGGVNNQSVFTMSSGIITDNKANDGGGIYNNTDGVLFVSGDSEISNNIATVNGGGVYNGNSTAITEDDQGDASSLFSISADNTSNAPFFMSAGTISGNTAEEGGGGVYNAGFFAMSFGEISENTSVTRGGGVANYGTFDMSGGEILKNVSFRFHGDVVDSTSGYGGGVHNGDTMTMSGGEISENAAYRGGGINNGSSATLTMTGGTITANRATGKGNGIFQRAEFTLGEKPTAVTSKVSSEESKIVITDNDVYLTSTETITETIKIQEDFTFSTDSKIEVSMENCGIFTDGYSETGTNYFTSYDPAYTITKVGGVELSLTAATTAKNLADKFTAGETYTFDYELTGEDLATALQKFVNEVMDTPDVTYNVKVNDIDAGTFAPDSVILTFNPCYEGDTSDGETSAIKLRLPLIENKIFSNDLVIPAGCGYSTGMMLPQLNAENVVIVATPDKDGSGEETGSVTYKITQIGGKNLLAEFSSDSTQPQDPKTWVNVYRYTDKHEDVDNAYKAYIKGDNDIWTKGVIADSYQQGTVTYPAMVYMEVGDDTSYSVTISRNSDGTNPITLTYDLRELAPSDTVALKNYTGFSCEEQLETLSGLSTGYSAILLSDEEWSGNNGTLTIDSAVDLNGGTLDLNGGVVTFEVDGSFVGEIYNGGEKLSDSSNYTVYIKNAIYEEGTWKYGAEVPVIAPDLSETEVEYIIEGTATALSVTASVSDDGILSYQWYSITTNSVADGTEISGATDSSYTPDITNVGTTYYYVVVTNTIGDTGSETSSSTTSAVAKIVVVEKTVAGIAIKTAPTKVAYTVGDSFDPTGLVITVTYNDGSTKDVTYAESTGFSFDNTALATGDTSVTITYGGQTATQDITVTAADSITSVAIEQGNMDLVQGNTQTFTATVEKTGTYTGAVEWTITGGTGTTTINKDTGVLTIDENQAVNSTITVTANSTEDNNESDSVTVTVLAAAQKPTFETDLSDSDATYTVGATETTAVSVTASVTDKGILTYQWYQNTSNSTSGGTVISDETYSTYTPPTTTEGTIYYYVVVTNTLNGTTATATSKVAKITVEAATTTPTITYTVTFNTDGGSSVATQRITSGQKVTKPTDPTKPDYTFAGWYSDSAFTTEFNFNTAITSATTIYAKWTEVDSTLPEPTTYTITLNPNGGTVSSTTLTTNEDGTVDSLPTPARSGYSFNGWYTASTSGTKISISTKFEGNTTIYAQWTKTTSSSSSGYVSASSTIPILNVATEGTASVSPSKIDNGKTGTITVTPKVGYVVDTITIIDADKNAVEVRAQEDGTYKFTQPIAKVTVNVTFAKGTSTAPDTSTPDSGTTDTTTPETPSVFPEEIFYDVNTTNWYYSPVKFVIENGLMSGTGYNTFSPDGDMLRGMAVTVLYALAERPIPSQNTYYADISTSDYYYLATQWASEQGVMSGIGDNLFSPSTSMTKEQMCLVFYKYALTQTNLVTGQASQATFADSASVNAWAKEAVNWCYSKGMILLSDGNMNPQADATRAEIATMLMVISLLSN